MDALRSTLPLLPALVALLACDVDHTASDYTQSNNKVATSANDALIELAPVVEPRSPATLPTTPAPLPELSLAMAPLAGGTLRGTARLAAFGEMTSIAATLSEGSSPTSYQGSLRMGSCDAIGTTLGSLVPITTDSTGSGAGVSYAEIPMDSLVRGSHVIVYGKSGRPESCATIGSTPA